VAKGSPGNGIIASAETKVVEASSAPTSDIALIAHRVKSIANSPCVHFFCEQEALLRTPFRL
jgi:hypothetical protein